MGGVVARLGTMHKPSISAAVHPRLLALAALIGALVALVFPAPRVVHKAALVTRPAAYMSHDVKPAVYTLGESTADEQVAWTQLMETLDLVRSSQAVLEEAQSLRAIAAALAAGSAQPNVERDSALPSREKQGADEVRRELAEGQLALADKILRTAQVHADNTQAALNVAWQNVLRAGRDNTWSQGSEDPLRQSGFPMAPPSSPGRPQPSTAWRVGSG